MNLTELLDQAAGRWPEKTALVEGQVLVSYASLVERVAGLAERLRMLGVGSGCRVGLCYPNSINYVALTFALWRLGAVVVPIPVEWTEEEVSGMSAVMELEVILSRQPVGPGSPGGEDWFCSRLREFGTVDNHGLNMAFIRFTSGTTSVCKGVVLCHETVRDRVRAANRGLGVGPSDTVMWCLPMSHHFLITIVLYLSEGATIVLSGHFLATLFLEEAARRRATVLYAAPFQYGLLARDESGLGLGSVRMAVSTTCGLPRDVAEDFQGRFGLPLVQALGVIELGLVSLNLEDPVGRWDSVGRPVGDCQVRILAPNEEGLGEVAVRGLGFFDAYAVPWLGREQVLEDGWFLTGDMGRVDREGFLFLAGRKTAVINMGGRKVFPEEVEEVLNRHPAVMEARVFGRPHPHLGEVVEAEVVLDAPDKGLDSLREFCRAHLASFKIPSRLHVVSALRRTAATGKIRRGVVMAGHD